MRTRFIPSTLIAYLCLILNTLGQGTFQNLDFEAAKVADLPASSFGETVYVTNGVPGWTVYIGGGTPPTMSHNSLPLGGAAVLILGPNWQTSQILQGKYTVYLIPSMAGPPTTASIGQTSQIPPGTESVRFYGAGSFGLTFDGQQIPLFGISSATNYTVFGGDLSSFAGQTGELRFTGFGLLDNIVFSSQSVPEPNVFGFCALGSVIAGVGLARRRRHG